MAAYGIPWEDIAQFLGIHWQAVNKHFGQILKKAKIGANTKMAESIYRAGLKGNMTAAIFWAKTQMKWKEASADTNLNVNTGGGNGKGAMIVVTPVAARVNPEQPGWVPPSGQQD
jgi:hypothetical protein